MTFRIPIQTGHERGFWDDKPSYVRKPLSNYEGYKRLEAGLEKSGRIASARHDIVCDVCRRHTRNSQLVPSVFGQRQHPPLQGSFLLCCTGPEGCAGKLERAGVVDEALRNAEAKRRLEALGFLGVA